MRRPKLGGRYTDGTVVTSKIANRSGSGTRPVGSNVVWRRISERIEERLSVIESAIAELLGGSLSISRSAECRAEASLLSDWFFALDQIVAGRVSRDIVDYFGGVPSVHDAATIAALVDRLRTITSVVEDEWGEAESTDARVHFISSANAQIDAVAWHLHQSGIAISYSPTFFSIPDDVDLVVLMMEHPDDAQQVLNLLGQRSSNVIRALVHTSDMGADDLLKVASSTDLLLHYAAAPVEIANQIMIALRPAQRAWSEAVLFGANNVAAELSSAGFTIDHVDNAQALIDKIEAGSRVVVIGHEAPRRSELVHLIRRSPSTRSAVVTASYANEAENERCSRAGANFTIPDIGERGTWAEQLRALTNANDHATGVVANDSTPLVSGQRAWVLLERAVGEIERGRGKAALATISLRAAPSDAEAQRIQALLAEEFRREDTVVSINAHNVAVLLRGAEIDDAVDRLIRAAANFEITAPPGMIGVAAFPDDGVGVKKLVEVASNAASRAALNAGPAIVRSDWFPGIHERLDVLVVESDPTLSGLLERLLANEGYDSAGIATGSAALHSLVGPDPIAPPRLILLELDAMGADGMMILRSLARAGIVEQSAVILTCSRVDDGQLREAFELGAVDVITKPFSSVVLRHRVSRAIES